MMTTPAVLATALEAWDAGISVIPIRDDGSKKPDIKWEDYQAERASREQVERWFTVDGYRAAAAICGPISGWLIMIEMEGADYEAGNWRRFRDAAVQALGEARWTEIAACVEMSPSGGPHLLIRCPGELIGNLKLARRRIAPKKVEVIMETRGRGGYTVIAGSVGHSSGEPWIRAQGTYADIATVTPDELEVILDAARSLDEMPAPAVRLDTVGVKRPRVSADSAFQSVVDDYNRRTRWDDVIGEIFEHAFSRGQIDYWHRRGSDNETGATTNATGNDTLIVFTSSTVFDCYDGVNPTPSYDRFSAHAALEYGGDRTAAFRALRDAGYGTLPTPPALDRTADNVADAHDSDEADDEEAEDHLPKPIDWRSFWQRDAPSEDWLIEPLIARGRATAMFAAAKVGKSLLMLEAAAALATGRPALSKPASDPVSVVYADYEMTEDDLYERLESLGYGPEDDLSNLHYYLLPALAPLNTAVGGGDFVTICERHDAQVAIIDTFGRALDGEENANDTYLGFYRHCGLLLKQRGIAYARLDHAGKDASKGQRGGSAKDGDVDIVWQLEPLREGLRLKRFRARMSWVPEHVDMHRRDDDTVLRHVVFGGGYPQGTAALVAVLERLGVPADASGREASRALRAAGEAGSNETVRAAQRYRQNAHEGDE